MTDISVGTGASKYTDLVTKYANTLASGSKASLDDKLAAWNNLGSLLFTPNENDGNIYQTNKNDYQRAIDLYNNSDLAKQMQQVDAQFNAAGLASAPSSNDGFNIAQNKLGDLARFSQDDQKMIFMAEQLNMPGALVIGNKDIYYPSLDAWKADLKQQAAAFGAQQQTPAATALATVAATASSAAMPALTTAPIATNAAKLASQARVTLPVADSAPATNASIALQILLTTQDAMQKSAAARQATQTEASGASAHAASRTAAMPQVNAPEALAASSGNQLNRLA